MEHQVGKDGMLKLSPQVNPFGWIRGLGFDMIFIVAIAFLSVVSAWICVRDPRMFPTILFLDLWVLGYHHVVATFTRLTFDLESFKENKFLIVWLPWIIVVFTVAAALFLGPWILATTYLYWQWFHYTRQSFGIARIYRRKTNLGPQDNALLEQLVIYGLPLAGIAWRSYQNPGIFLGMELRVLPVPFWAVKILLNFCVVILFWWLIQQFIDLKQGRFRLGYSLYMISHIVVFTAGYILISDINYGWLCLNVWHNAQYVVLVWMFNNNRFKNGIDPHHRFLSTISQTKNVVIYYAVCLAISTVVYNSIDHVIGFFKTTLPLAMIVYQTINFHHYIVDGIIWKLRQKPLSKNLGLVK